MIKDLIHFKSNSPMKKSILHLGKVLSKTEQKKVNGQFGGCDIAPPNCPCIVPPNHPCLNGSGGGSGSTGTCFGPFGTYTVQCNSTCDDGSQPIC